MLHLSQISPYYPSGKDGDGEKTRRMKWTEARRCWQSFWMHTVSRNDDPEQSDEERDPGGGVSEGGTQGWCLGGGAGSNPEKDPVIDSAWAARQVGERAARLAAQEEGEMAPYRKSR